MGDALLLRGIRRGLQVVSDYLTVFDGEEKMMKAMNKAVTLYTYRMSFTAA